MNPEFNEIVQRLLDAWRSAFPDESRPDPALKAAFIDEMANQHLAMKYFRGEGFSQDDINQFMKHPNLGL